MSPRDLRPRDVESKFLPDEAATESYGRALAARLPRGAVVFLHGDLGAGKTTLVRGILRGLGYTGSVKSPTYTILEPHDLPFAVVYHFDFYRIADSQELDFLGMDELISTDALKLIEWPERVSDRLPEPDVEVRMLPEGGGRRLEIIFNR
jgi:tRNA threonylcarbamoyladenosine biosynthesis protein TsaE